VAQSRAIAGGGGRGHEGKHPLRARAASLAQVLDAGRVRAGDQGEHHFLLRMIPTF
jgi:hypothetical protein